MMSVLRTSQLRRRSTLFRVALALATMAQLVIAAVAPLAEVRARQQDAQAHVEREGTRLHHAHVEALCPSCAAHHLVGHTPRAGAALPATVRHFAPPPARLPLAAGVERDGTSSPRAPPRSE